ncbi:MAG: DNA polymerase III subunit alpha [Spirochaetes bacterium]|nr:DNA polymerase III subunit alpha [Spirochaetota bacterium]
MDNFVFLENHSVYSLCEGTIFVSELVSYAKKNGFRYLSICDTNGFYGIVRFIEACREEGLAPVISSRIKSGFFNGILVARTMRGYAKICNFISQVRINSEYDLRDVLRIIDSDYYVITDNTNVLEIGNANLYAEINILNRDYFDIYRYAKKRKIKTVLIYPVYFKDDAGLKLHTLLRAIHGNKKLSALNADEVQRPDARFVPCEDVAARFSYMTDAIANTHEIAENSQFDFRMGSAIFPKYTDNGFFVLKDMCYANIEKRYPAASGDERGRIIARLEKELAVIKRKGFADYFLVVQDIVRQTMYTCGRGSAASSIVSYLLFITHVDPVKHNLFFERFINDGRADPPDIDVDFPWDTRDDILAYIFNRYSTDNVAMVSNHITFSVRSSVREVAKVYGIPENEIKKITKNIGFYYNRESDEIKNYSKNAGTAGEWRSIYEQAVGISGMVRHMSVHCGGVVITPKPVRYYIPVEKAAKGVNIIQLEKDQAEDFGFIKIDILGNRSLAVVRDVLALVKDHYGKEIKYEEFNPLDDAKTISMLAAGESMGVFYVESPAMRQLQKKSRKGDYEHLVIHSSIIRPAANTWINEYLERLRGKPFNALIAGMEKILEETYGIMCYQEDITKIAMEIADFSLSEGEELRKVVSKKSRQKRKMELRDKMYENLRKKHIEDRVIAELWDMIESFSGYSFCKAHSASYALLSFKSCFLKAHYPAEFMGAVMKNKGGFYTTLAYISEARRMGLKIVPPDINESEYEFFGCRDSVYIGFMQIKEVSHRGIMSIIRERNANGKYKSLSDFLRRTDAGPSDTGILIKAGCFDKIEKYNQPQLLFIARKFFHTKRRLVNEELFSGVKYEEIFPPPLRDITYDQKLKQELYLYDSFISIHPMMYYRNSIKENGIIFAKELEEYIGKRVKVAGILITSKTVMTKDDKLMKFISFEDETAIFESVFFPKAYKKFALMLSYQRPYILTGKVDVEFDTIIFNAMDIRYV